MAEKTWREITTEWRGGMNFVSRNASGGTVELGVPGSEEAGSQAISPMELMLIGLAGCTGMDVVSILEKKRQPPQAFSVRVRGLRADDPPRVYTEIEVEYLLWGENLQPEAVEQAIHLSEEKYCSVGAMLGKTAQIRSTYRILPLEM
jgi:putative redox protein